MMEIPFKEIVDLGSWGILAYCFIRLIGFVIDIVKSNLVSLNEGMLSVKEGLQEVVESLRRLNGKTPK